MRHVDACPTILAVAAICLCSWNPAGAAFVVTDFTRGQPSNDTLIRGAGPNIQGFGVRGNTFAYWGYSFSGDDLFAPPGVALSIGKSLNQMRTYRYQPSVSAIPTQGPSRAIAFDSRGNPLAAFVEAGPSGNLLRVMGVDPSAGAMTVITVSSDASTRYVSLASSTAGRYAASSTDDYPVPLAYGPDGTLYQAVTDSEGGSRALHFLSKTPQGTSSDVVIDTASFDEGNNGEGSAYIDLTVDPFGHPLVLDNWTHSARGLNIDLFDGTSWTDHVIPLGFETGGPKEILFDSNGDANILLSDLNGDVYYILLSRDDSVLEERSFLGSSLFGMGFDDSGRVYLGYDAPLLATEASPLVATPEPSSLILFATGILGVFAASRWRPGGWGRADAPDAARVLPPL